MLLLTDIYCMYNRARGTDLVSPDDVLAACKQLQRLRLGMKLRVFSSGVMVVQSDSHDPAAVVARLMKLLKSREYLDAAFLARTWRVSVPVAEEHLHVRVRVLCVYVFVCCCLFVCVLMQPLAVGDSRATLVSLGVAGCCWARPRSSAAICAVTIVCKGCASTPTSSSRCLHRHGEHGSTAA